MDSVQTLPAFSPPTFSCPHCQTVVAVDAFFCPHCGRKLKDPPPSTSPMHITAVVLAAVFLPPAGLFTGLKYLKQPEEKSRNIGYLLISLTIISILVTVWFTIVAIQDAEKIVNSQLGGPNIFQQNNHPSNSGFIDQQLGL